MDDDLQTDERALDLLYPFYLDTDMSMAFAAALTGGIALEAEQVNRSGSASESVRKIQGNLKLWRAGSVEGGRSNTDASDATSEARLVRRHTVASIFIDLYDELRRQNLVKLDPQIDDLQVGDIVSVELGPAVAPLRRVVDQVIRLLDVMVPLASESETGDPVSHAAPRQQRRQQARELAKHGSAPSSEEGPVELQAIRRLFVALSADLEHSGMIDIVITREGAPSAILTLDKRFVSPPTLELLHTSGFRVVGKVTQLWPDSETGVNLYRRSVLALVPSLGQSVAWGVFALLGGLARSLDVKSMEQMAWSAIGQPAHSSAPPSESSADEAEDGEAGTPNDVLIGEDVAALTPLVLGPAYQVLPLAICS